MISDSPRAKVHTFNGISVAIDVRLQGNAPYKVQMTADDDPTVSKGFDVSGKTFQEALALGVAAAEDWIDSRPIAVEGRYQHLGYDVLFETVGPAGGRFRFIFNIFHKGDVVEGGFAKSADDYVSREDAKNAAIRAFTVEVQRYY